jgi:hypothetical protein
MQSASEEQIDRLVSHCIVILFTQLFMKCTYMMNCHRCEKAIPGKPELSPVGQKRKS